MVRAGLVEYYHKRGVYSAFVPTKVDLQAQRTQTMHFNMMFDLEPNITAIGNTEMWLSSQYTDSAMLTLTTEHHAGKVSLHRFISAGFCSNAE